MLAVLSDLAAQVAPKPGRGIFRLPIDRVFTIKGFGTVVTGTAGSGSLKVGDAVMVYPPGYKARVRGLQVHGESVEEALAGNRAAINLQGLEKEELERGMVVAPQGTLIPSRRLDAFLEILASAPRALKHRQAVRLHTGTSESVAMPLLLDADELPPGGAGNVQFFLREPLALKPGDRFVIRSFSPAFTWGGGQFLHVQPPRHKRNQAAVLDGLKILQQGSPEDTLRFHLQEAGAAGRSRDELLALLPWDGQELDVLINALKGKGECLPYDPENQRFLLTSTAKELEEEICRHLSAYHKQNPLKSGLSKEELEEICRHLSAYHKQNPLKSGLSKEELRRKLPPQMEVRLFNYLLNRLVAGKRIALEQDLVRLAAHKVQLAGAQEDLSQKMEDLYRRGQLSPPTLKEVEAALNTPLKQLQALLQMLTRQGRLVKVKEDLYFHQEAIAGLKSALVDFLKKNKEITVVQFKDLTQVSRKFTIPLLEYFDTTRTTVRVGETRRLREGV
ncbi:MAG: SelB C-terminal domain-containing protein [Deltaproteobacteria bacterium]|nr:SelB C-terminal domain-containing protein [Deltaproteobacteria bacterium]